MPRLKNWSDLSWIQGSKPGREVSEYMSKSGQRNVPPDKCLQAASVSKIIRGPAWGVPSWGFRLIKGRRVNHPPVWSSVSKECVLQRGHQMEILGWAFPRRNEDKGDLLRKVPRTHLCTQGPHPSSRPPPTHASARDSRTLTGKPGPGSCGVPASSSGSWRSQVSVCALPESVPQSCVRSGGSMVG